MTRSRSRLAWLIISGFLLFPAWSGSAADHPEFGLGDEPMSPELYDSLLVEFPSLEKGSYRAHLDYRDSGYVTPAKNQSQCGGCWSFAATGAIESAILMSGGPLMDLSEQFLLSCCNDYSGCCGGSWYYAYQFHQSHKPIQDSCLPFGDAARTCSSFTNCPPTCSSVACNWGCPEIGWKVSGSYSVNATSPSQVISALNADGPAYFRFDVYNDFHTYWHASPGTAPWSDGRYRQLSGAHEGGHAVLIIGYDDVGQYWICKNSWGTTGGPWGDGTFRMAWTGHTNDLDFGMGAVRVQQTGGSATATPNLNGLRVRLQLPTTFVRPGETFYVNGLTETSGDPLTGVPICFVLDVFGQYYFWPSWRHYNPPYQTSIDLDYRNVPATISVLPSFTWPTTGGGDVHGLNIHGAILSPGMTGLWGSMDTATFGYAGGGGPAPTPTATPASGPARSGASQPAPEPPPAPAEGAIPAVQPRTSNPAGLNRVR